MKVVVQTTPNSAGKAAAVVDEFHSLFRTADAVLDVGCRVRQLETAMQEHGACGQYIGADLANTGDVVADLGSGLPFRTRSFDVVVALDVIEHVDGLCEAVEELCRATRRFLVISVPNLYDVKYRLAHAVGQPISAKYGLPAHGQSDRHRWFFSLNEAQSFFRVFCEERGWHLFSEAALVGPRRGIRGLRAVVSTIPNFLSPTYLLCIDTVPYGTRPLKGRGESGRETKCK